MAFKQIGITVGGNKREFICLSGDTKETTDNEGKPFGGGSTCLELDTKATYMFDGISTWYQI